jgi:hypothetical protein
MELDIVMLTSVMRVSFVPSVANKPIMLSVIMLTVVACALLGCFGRKSFGGLQFGKLLRHRFYHVEWNGG